MKVILASQSPRRQELLKRLFSEFEIIPSDIDETIPEDIGAEFAPVFLAAEKALHISEKYPNDLVVAADTIVVLDGEILGKPMDNEDAKNMLTKLSGNTHKVITGCCIRLGEDCCTFSEESLVTFFPLTEEEIDAYIASGATAGKAGAYGIQDQAALFVERIDGDFYNIVGLPIARLSREIKYMLSE
ncbi:MAG: septum formation protein Maf [Clostridia bacterium]|nr:septum formation protein Maf [Clostridia bacterium]